MSTTSEDEFPHDLSIVDWDKYTDEAVSFIFAESEKLLIETLSAYRENVNKVYAVMGVYSVTLVYAYNNLINDSTSSNWILFSGCTATVVINLINFFPSSMTFTGAEPKMMIHPYYEWFKEKNQQVRQYHIRKSIGNQAGIESHLSIVTKRVKGSSSPFGYIA